MAALTEAVRAFLDQPLLASISTLYADGSPHVTFVWYELAGEAILVSTTEGRQKAVNLRRDPRAALAVLDPGNPYRWVSVTGRVELTRIGAPELIRRLAVRYLGREQGEPYGQTLATPDRVVVRLTPERVIAYGF